MSLDQNEQKKDSISEYIPGIGYVTTNYDNDGRVSSLETKHDDNSITVQYYDYDENGEQFRSETVTTRPDNSKTVTTHNPGGGQSVVNEYNSEGELVSTASASNTTQANSDVREYTANATASATNTTQANTVARSDTAVAISTSATETNQRQIVEEKPLGPWGLYGTETTSIDENGNKVVTQLYRNGNSEETVTYPDGTTVTTLKMHDTSAPGSREKGPVNVTVTTTYPDGTTETERHFERELITGAKVETDTVTTREGTQATTTTVDRPEKDGEREVETETDYRDENGQEIDEKAFEESRNRKYYANTSEGGAQANADQQQARANVLKSRHNLDKEEGPQAHISILKKYWTTDSGGERVYEMQAFCDYMENGKQAMLTAANTVKDIQLELIELDGTSDCNGSC